MFDSLQLHGLYSPWISPGQNIGVGSHSLLQGIFPTQGSNPGLSQHRWILYSLRHQGSLIMKAVAAAAKLLQLCPTLCDPMDYTVHGILQARILDWVAFPFSRGSSQPKITHLTLSRCVSFFFFLILFYF